METATAIQPISQTATDNIAIRVSGLRKRYLIGGEKKGSLAETLSGMIGAKNNRKEEFWALQDINFEVKKGEVIGIIGKNGAGKSTLLKILSRITQPTTGKIEINGRVASLLEVGTGFHPELTGRENIYLNGTILGMSRQEVKDKFEEIVEFSGVRKFIDTPVKHYSSGMYVRLAFAVAAHLEPEILIIDEVLAVGDAEFQRKCLGKMKEVAGEGRTVLFVSHNMAAVKSLCNRVIVLNQGTNTFNGLTNFGIETYLNGDRKSETIVTNTQLGAIYLNELSVRKISGDPTEPISMSDSFDIHLDFNNPYKDVTNINFRVKDERGNYLFVVTSTDFGIEISPNNNNIIKCRFPSNFFNEGVLFIDIMIVKNFKEVYAVENDIIKITIQSEGAGVGKWMGKTLGALKPKLEWIKI